MEVIVGATIGAIVGGLLIFYLMFKFAYGTPNKREIPPLTPVTLPTLMNITRTLTAPPENGLPLTEKPKQMIVVMDNTGIEVPEGSVIPVTLGGQTRLQSRSPNQIAENLATAFSRKRQATSRNILAAELKMLLGRPSRVGTKIRKSRKGRSRK